MKIKMFIFVGVFSLTGCEASSMTMTTPINGPHAEHWLGIDCAGRSQNACLYEAGYQCPSGYSIIDNDSHFSYASSGRGAVVGAVGSFRSNTHEVHNGSMLIACIGKSRADIESYQENLNKKNEDNNKCVTPMGFVACDDSE